MLDITFSFLSSILSAAANIAGAVFVWVYSALMILHTDFPRIEGLLIGVVFAWFFVHREKSSVVRILAAPLKIVLDILDIIYDETVEAVSDFAATVLEKLVSVKQKIVNTAKSLYTGVVSWLTKIRDTLKKNEEE